MKENIHLNEHSKNKINLYSHFCSCILYVISSLIIYISSFNYISLTSFFIGFMIMLFYFKGYINSIVIKYNFFKYINKQKNEHEFAKIKVYANYIRALSWVLFLLLFSYILSLFIARFEFGNKHALSLWCYVLASVMYLWVAMTSLTPYKYFWLGDTSGKIQESERKLTNRLFIILSSVGGVCLFLGYFVQF